MEEKKGVKISFISLFIILVCIVSIVVLVAQVSKINNEKLAVEKEVAELKLAIEELKNNNSKKVVVENKNEVEINRKDTDFFGVFVSEDEKSKYAFLPNGETYYKNGDFSCSGTYDIKENNIYFNENNLNGWIEGKIDTSSWVIEIKDEDTLVAGSQKYSRTFDEKLEGTYNIFDGTMILNNDGSFEILRYGYEEPVTGKFEIENNILVLKDENGNKIEELYNPIYLILDNNIIVSQHQVEGIYYYNAYIKNK